MLTLLPLISTIFIRNLPRLIWKLSINFMRPSFTSFLPATSSGTIYDISKSPVVCYQQTYIQRTYTKQQPSLLIENTNTTSIKVGPSLPALCSKPLPKSHYLQTLSVEDAQQEKRNRILRQKSSTETSGLGSSLDYTSADELNRSASNSRRHSSTSSAIMNDPKFISYNTTVNNSTRTVSWRPSSGGSMALGSTVIVQQPSQTWRNHHHQSCQPSPSNISGAHPPALVRGFSKSDHYPLETIESSGSSHANNDQHSNTSPPHSMTADFIPPHHNQYPYVDQSASVIFYKYAPHPQRSAKSSQVSYRALPPPRTSRTPPSTSNSAGTLLQKHKQHSLDQGLIRQAKYKTYYNYELDFGTLIYEENESATASDMEQCKQVEVRTHEQHRHQTRQERQTTVKFRNDCESHTTHQSKAIDPSDSDCNPHGHHHHNHHYHRCQDDSHSPYQPPPTSSSPQPSDNPLQPPSSVTAKDQQLQLNNSVPEQDSTNTTQQQSHNHNSENCQRQKWCHWSRERRLATETGRRKLGVSGLNPTLIELQTLPPHCRSAAINNAATFTTAQSSTTLNQLLGASGDHANQQQYSDNPQNQSSGNHGDGGNSQPNNNNINNNNPYNQSNNQNNNGDGGGRCQGTAAPNENSQLSSYLSQMSQKKHVERKRRDEDNRLTHEQIHYLVEYWDHDTFVRLRSWALCFALLAVVLQIFVGLSRSWSFFGDEKSPNYSGLWSTCIPKNNTCKFTFPFTDPENGYRDSILCLVAVSSIFSIGGSGLSFTGLCVTALARKLYYYHSAGEIFFVSGMTMAFAVSLYPVTIEVHLKYNRHRYGYTFWLAWVAALLLLISAVNLLMDELVQGSTKMNLCGANAQQGRGNMGGMTCCFVRRLCCFNRPNSTTISSSGGNNHEMGLMMGRSAGSSSCSTSYSTRQHTPARSTHHQSSSHRSHRRRGNDTTTRTDTMVIYPPDSAQPVTTTIATISASSSSRKHRKRSIENYSEENTQLISSGNWKSAEYDDDDDDYYHRNGDEDEDDDDEGEFELDYDYEDAEEDFYDDNDDEERDFRNLKEYEGFWTAEQFV